MWTARFTGWLYAVFPGHDEVGYQDLKVIAAIVEQFLCFSAGRHCRDFKSAENPVYTSGSFSRCVTEGVNGVPEPANAVRSLEPL